jgi:hypothetical protein
MMGRCAQNRYGMAQGRVLGKETSIMYWRSGQKNQAAFQIIVYNYFIYLSVEQANKVNGIWDYFIYMYDMCGPHTMCGPQYMSAFGIILSIYLRSRQII